MKRIWTATITVSLSNESLDRALELLRELLRDLPRPVLDVHVAEGVDWTEEVDS